MRDIVSLILWGVVFSAVCLYMFFSLNPFMIVILLAVWHPLEKRIDKVMKR